MAHGITDPDNRKEYFDSAFDLNKKLDQLTQMIKSSQHFIVFTGAGISTSTGIPDFRSTMDTVLPTGPGEWELEDHKKKRQKTSTVVDDMQKAIPSVAHMALVALQRQGILKCVISQNCDGLHLRSGLTPSKLAELHGNMNLETCAKCQTRYLRDFDTVGNDRHYTGRRCDQPNCGGRLKDSIINFGEDLPEAELNTAFDHAEKADLCLVLGSSLTVTPACDIPKRVAKRRKILVIGNLQRTPLYKKAKINIHAFTDDIMKGIMERLNTAIPPWILQRRIHISCRNESETKNKMKIIIESRDPNDPDIPYTLFESIELLINRKVIQQLVRPPFTLEISCNQNPQEIIIRLHFFGHYNEVPFDITYANIENIAKKGDLCLFYNPRTGVWRTDIDEVDSTSQI